MEGRYDGLIGRWTDAGTEKAKVSALREQYAMALQARRDAEQQETNMRAQRDLAKNDFLDVYAEVANRVRALFPRDRKKQDLFFDAISERSSEPTKTNASKEKVVTQ